MCRPTAWMQRVFCGRSRTARRACAEGTGALADALRYARVERRIRQPVSDCSRRSTRHKRQANHMQETAKPNNVITTNQATPCSKLVIRQLSFYEENTVSLAKCRSGSSRFEEN